MTSAAHLIKGWCPGALRPMRSGDGLLVRIRPRAGAFSLSALSTIAEVAAGFGSGEIDLTNRGNLQIRGISETTFESALALLSTAGLLDNSIDAEAVRNIIVDPLSGLDPARTDVRDLARQLDTIISRDQRLWLLPGKFGFSLSGVADPRVGGRSADIMLSAIGDRCAIRLDGAGDTACEISRGDAVAAMRDLALVFIELIQSDASFRRMRDAVAKLGAATVFAMAGLKGVISAALYSREKAQTIGVLVDGDRVFAAGIGLPFGRILASQLDVLRASAVMSRSGDVRTGVNRALVFPVADANRAHALLLAADGTGLITRPDNARLAMDVCPGSPACRNATSDTRRDAQRLADELASSIAGYSLHISGCEKGCARRSDANITLVGRGGLYDIVRDGCASSAPAVSNVKPEDIGAAITRLIKEPTA